MSVFKRYRGKRITSKDKDWAKGTYYVWRRVNGKIVHRALKDATTKEQAEAAERKIIDKAFNQRFGIPDHSTTFKEFADGPYTRYAKQKNVNITAKLQYIRLLNEFFGSQILNSITPQDCRDCQDTMTKKGYSASSVNLIMSTASKMFTIAGQEGVMDRNPMAFVERLEEPPPRSRLLTDEEKERLWFQLSEDVLMLRLVTLATNLPLRRGQILAITPDAVDVQNGLLFAVSSKGRESRAVPLNSIVSGTIALMISEGQLPFPLKDFRKRWKRILVSAGINKKDGKRGENFTFHDLRKEFASNLIRNNVNPNIVQKLFAHSDMRITNVYMHAEMDQLKEAVNTLDATDLQPTSDAIN